MKCVYCDSKLYEPHPYCVKAENLTPKQVQRLVVYYNDYVDYRTTTEYHIMATGKRKLKLTKSAYNEFDDQFICELNDCYDDLKIDYSEVPCVIEHLEKEHADFWLDEK